MTMRQLSFLERQELANRFFEQYEGVRVTQEDVVDFLVGEDVISSLDEGDNSDVTILADYIMKEFRDRSG